MSAVVPQRVPAAPEPLPADAVDRVVGQHLRSLWRHLRMHGASAAEADDLAQEAFVVALQKGVLLQGVQSAPAATAAFLRTTARFLFLRHRKAGRRGARLADAVDELWARDCGRDDGDALIALLRGCVGELAGRARTVVELGYGLGDRDPQGRAAIARELGMQENGVKTLLQRVRQQLRECIERRRER